MAAPIRRSDPNSEHGGPSVLSRRTLRLEQQKAAMRAAMRRRLVWTEIEEATQSTVSELVVLQKDLDNVVVAPTGGYIKAEIVFTGNTISIYVPP